MVHRLKREFTYADDLVFISKMNGKMPLIEEISGRQIDGDMMQDISFASSNGLPRIYQAADVAERMDAQRSGAPSVAESTGLHFLGKRVQVLVDAISDFREFGVDHVVELPDLVLVGDQSAGKSSLMGALAEIHLPRSAGCCTRCPAHIKTGPAAEWSCKISLHQHYSYEPTSGKPLDSRDVTKNRPFPPWKEQALKVKPFMTITDKRELENALKWAQVATLNHNKPHTLYVPTNNSLPLEDEQTEAKFSPNVVFVEIAGPGLPPLSFYDLPGVFQNAGQKEDQYLVKVIENLATEYIRHPQALIICALPMSADPATSRTGKLIADLNAESRTIGVLTKADRLQDGQGLGDFQSILEGRDHIVGHGYFVTKLPGSSVADSYDEQYHMKARFAEDEFFGSRAPWATEWAHFNQRYGTRRLQIALQQKFAQQIVNSMPTIQRKIRYRAAEIDTELRKLPDLPMENINHVVLQHLAEFSAETRAMLGGESSHVFQSTWTTLCEQFRDCIMAMRPGITIVHHSDGESFPFAQREVINLEESDHDEIIASTPKAVVRKRGREDQVNGAMSDKRTKVNGTPAKAAIVPPVATPKQEATLPIRSSTPITPTPVASMSMPRRMEDPFEPLKNLGSNFATLDGIRESIARYRRTGVPGHINLKVQEEMCLDSVMPWEQPMELLLDLTLQNLRQSTNAVLEDILGVWQQTQLFKESKKHLASFFDDFEIQQRQYLNEVFRLESYKLFTMNQEAFDRNKAAQLTILQEARKRRRTRVYVDRLHPNVNPEVRASKMKQVTEQMLGPDPFKMEIEVAGYVRGYYATAAQRFVDQVCLSLNGRLIRDCRVKILQYLEQKLELTQSGAEERCKELMEENASVAQKRQALKQEKENLNKFTSRLLRLAAESQDVHAENA